jgi:hypothetical protein
MVNLVLAGPAHGIQGRKAQLKMLVKKAATGSSSPR